jgi:hypothetical protein
LIKSEGGFFRVCASSSEGCPNWRYVQAIARRDDIRSAALNRLQRNLRSHIELDRR